MKKKMVIRLFMNCQKCRSKALKIVGGFPGVESAALKGDDKNEIEVTGVEVDAACLTRKLRKKMGHAELVSLGDADKDKGKDKPAEKNKPPEPTPQQLVAYYGGGVPCEFFYPAPCHYDNPSCSIM